MTTLKERETVGAVETCASTAYTRTGPLRHGGHHREQGLHRWRGVRPEEMPVPESAARYRASVMRRMTFLPRADGAGSHAGQGEPGRRRSRGPSIISSIKWRSLSAGDV
jgi:hypothetical protein